MCSFSLSFCDNELEKGAIQDRDASCSWQRNNEKTYSQIHHHDPNGDGEFVTLKDENMADFSFVVFTFQLLNNPTTFQRKYQITYFRNFAITSDVSFAISGSFQAMSVICLRHQVNSCLFLKQHVCLHTILSVYSCSNGQLLFYWCRLCFQAFYQLGACNSS